MLNFHLNLQSPLFTNLEKYYDHIRDCHRRQVPFLLAMKVVREQFSELTEEQFFELRYEWQEFMSVKFCKRRHSAWDITKPGRDKLRDMLIARSESDFAKNPYFIQFIGRGMYMPKDASDLIGKQVRIQIKRKKDE